MNEVFVFLQFHYQFVLIGAGLLFLLAALFDWTWLCETTITYKIKHAFLFSVFGDAGYRVYTGICGAVLILCGGIFLWLG